MYNIILYILEVKEHYKIRSLTFRVVFRTIRSKRKKSGPQSKIIFHTGYVCSTSILILVLLFLDVMILLFPIHHMHYI